MKKFLNSRFALYGSALLVIISGLIVINSSINYLFTVEKIQKFTQNQKAQVNNFTNVNIVKNGDFENDINGWTPYGKADLVTIVTENGNKYLQIKNDDGKTNIGAIQNIKFDKPYSGELVISVRLKVDEFNEKTLAALDLGLKYSDGSPMEYYVGPLRSVKDDVGRWVLKQSSLTLKKPINSLDIICVSYYDKTLVSFDNVEVFIKNNESEQPPTSLPPNPNPDPNPTPDSFSIKKGNYELVVSSSGLVEKLNYNNINQLNSRSPIAQISLLSGSKIIPDKFIFVSGNEYKMTFTNPDISMKMNIIPYDKYLKFNITEFSNPSNQSLKSIEFLHLDLNSDRVAQLRRDWAINASDDNLFMNVRPMNIYTVCGPLGTTYTCQVLPEDLNQAGGFLILSSKKDYFKAEEDLIITEGMPHVEQNGKWFRANGANTEPYLFATFTHANHQKLLDLAKQGGFKQVLMVEPIVRGSYNNPRLGLFSNLDQMVQDMQKFVNSGINVGIHTFFNNVHYLDPNFHLEDVLKYQIGTLAENVSPVSNTIRLDPATFKQSDMEYYGLNWIGKTGYDFYIIQIGNDIIKTSSDLSGLSLKNIEAMWNSSRSEHAIGAPVYVIPHIYGQHAFMRAGSPSQQRAIENLADLSVKLGANFFYADGWSYPEKKEIRDTFFSFDLERYGVWPFIKRIIEKTGKYPLIQTGSGISTSFFYYFNNRSASNDGVDFEDKDYTRDYKALQLKYNNPYAKVLLEMGWWKFHGAYIGNGRYDIEATTDDDLHYTMMKTLANHVSIGLQLGFLYDANKALNHLSLLMGEYNEFIRKEITNNLLSKQLLDYLAKPEIEAELIDGNSIIEKRVQRLSVILNKTGDYSSIINNSFSKSGNFKMEIRPRTDYFGYSNSENSIISNFSNISSSQIISSASNISCSLTSNGLLTITNQGGASGGCKITFNGTFDLTGKRGVGISLSGDGKSESILIRLANGLYAYRDFNSTIDFSGNKEIIIGQPSTSAIKQTHWEFDYKNITSVEVTIGNVSSGQSSTIQLNSLKALKEKPLSPLVNPVVTINDQKIIFDGVILYISDTKPNILEYDGNSGVYNVYTSNRDLLSSGKTQAIFQSILKSGTNDIKFSADISDSLNSSRADLRFTIYDSKALFGSNKSKQILSILEVDSPPPPILRATDGLCGTTLNSCTQGILRNTEDSTTQYLWMCLGSNNGFDASCSQTRYIPPVTTNPPTNPINQPRTPSTYKPQPTIYQTGTTPNKDTYTLTIPTTTIDITLPKLPSWLDIIKALFNKIITNVIRGVKRTGEVMGI